MSNNVQQEIKLITIRSASSFGFQLANNMAERLEGEDLLPSRWPTKFPITLKQICKSPEVAGNEKVAKRINEAACMIWKDMRKQAIEIERDMMLHPEYYEDILGGAELDIKSSDTVWRYLSVEIEQIAGHVFITELQNEDVAKKNIYSLLSAQSLKKFIIDFEDDYKNFANEIREAIRNKKGILPSIRLELICLLGTNTKRAQKLAASVKKRR